jgi:flagellar hook-length control protein FliK
MSLLATSANLFTRPASGDLGVLGSAAASQPWAGQFQQSLAAASSLFDSAPASGQAPGNPANSESADTGPDARNDAQDSATDANQSSSAPRRPAAARKQAKDSAGPDSGTADKSAQPQDAGSSGTDASQAAEVSGAAAPATTAQTQADGSGKDAAATGTVAASAAAAGGAAAGVPGGGSADTDAAANQPASGASDALVEAMKAKAMGGAGSDQSAAADAKASAATDPATGKTQAGASDKPALSTGTLLSAGALLGTDPGSVSAGTAPVAQPQAGVPAGAAANAASANAGPAGAAANPAVSADDANAVRVARGMQSALSQGGGTVTLRLQPPDLGLVRIQMQVQDGVVSAQVTAERDTVRDLLSHQLGQLRTALESHGLTVDRLDVQTAPRALGQTLGSGDRSEQAPQDGRSRGQYARQDTGGGGRDSGEGRRDPTPGPAGFEQELVNLVA